MREDKQNKLMKTRWYNKREVKIYSSLFCFLLLFVLAFNIQSAVATEGVRSEPHAGGGGGSVLSPDSIDRIGEEKTAASFSAASRSHEADNIARKSGVSELIIDSSISEEYRKDNVTELRLIVNLRDDSDIIIIGDKNQRRDRLLQIDDWFKPRVDNVLKNYPEESGVKIIKKRSRGFVASVTEKGFTSLENDPYVSEIYIDRPLGILLSASVPHINADNVQSLGYDGTGIKVCVIDSGVNASHPDLSGVVVDEYCYCGGGCCPDNTSEDNDAEDDNGHGTHVTGIIASQNPTYKGVAPGVDIYAVKVTNSQGTGYISDFGDGIEKCRAWGVDIISMSLGDYKNHPGDSACPTEIDTDINNAYNQDIPVVIAFWKQHV